MPTPMNAGGGLFEPIEGDSLTQQIRALVNMLIQQGQGTFQQGQDWSGQAIQGIDKAGATIDPAVKYWTDLLSGDSTKMSAAVAPTANAMSAQYTAAGKSAEANLPRGGYSSVVQANLPFQKAGAIGDLFANLQPTAAQQLNTLAGTQGNLAGIKANLGLGTAGLGANMFSNALQGQLQRRGQNFNVDTANRQMLTQGLTSILNPFAQQAAKNWGGG